MVGMRASQNRSLRAKISAAAALVIQYKKPSAEKSTNPKCWQLQ